MPAPGYVYFLRMFMPEEFDSEDAPSLIKIGYTAGEAGIRKQNLGTGTPFDIEIETVFPGTKGDEKALHERFASSRMKREWFKSSDEMEDFIADMFDARTLLQIERGEDYEPTLKECMAIANPGAKLNRWLSEASKALRDAGIQQIP